MRGLLAAGLTMVLYVAAQVILFHAVSIRRKLAVMLALWAGGLGVYGLVYSALPDDAAWLPAWLAADGDVVTAANGIFVYWAFFAGYYQFVNMADNSVGVRCLVELAALPPGGLTLAGLERRYRSGEMVHHRLERLVAAGFLARDAAGRFRCRPKARIAARVFGGLKRVLALGPGG
ncbi:MAG: hypothetical protein HY216_04870 [Candidatus Rokubacteria bacterium]|nr:hypothetical protein [Candidatus Rokubacteria bacterium]